MVILLATARKFAFIAFGFIVAPQLARPATIPPCPANTGCQIFRTRPDTVITDPSTKSSEPVDAGIWLRFSNNHIDIIAVNFLTNPKGDISNLNAFDFQFKGSPGIPTAGASMTTSAIMRTIYKRGGGHLAGDYTDSASVSNGWILTQIPNGLKVNGQINPPFPARGIIGKPNPVTNRYDAANGSIAGSSSHNPFQATITEEYDDARNPFFRIVAPGVTANTRVENVHFFFGTGTFLSTSGNQVASYGPGVYTPEPGSVALSALGLAAFGWLSYRKRRAMRRDKT